MPTFQKYWDEKIKARWIRRRNDSRHLSLGIVPGHISKGNKNKMSPI
jgi:hypothetical protein